MMDGGDDDGGNGQKPSGNWQPHITWDEETIAEHNKLRGTRQKIDEPSTPYHYQSASSDASDNESAEDSGSGGSALGSVSGAACDERGQGERIMQVMNEVEMRLPAENDLRRERATRWDPDFSDSDGGGGKEDPEQSRQFKQLRSQHYNEFQALQQWRRRHYRDDGEADADEDDDGSDRTENSGPDRDHHHRSNGVGGPGHGGHGGFGGSGGGNGSGGGGGSGDRGGGHEHGIGGSSRQNGSRPHHNGSGAEERVGAISSRMNGTA